MLVGLLALLDRLLAPLLLAVLAVAGAAAAVFCIQGGTATLSLHHLAGLLSLPDLRDAVRDFLDGLEGSGATAIVPLLGGLGAIVLGLALLAGLLVPRRERLVRLEDRPAGPILARRRALARTLGALAEQAPGVTTAKARVRPRRRRRGGRARVTAVRTLPAEPRKVRDAVAAQIAPVADPFGLRARLATRPPRRPPRVQ